jgi:hypothetical protein
VGDDKGGGRKIASFIRSSACHHLADALRAIEEEERWADLLVRMQKLPTDELARMLQARG